MIMTDEKLKETLVQVDGYINSGEYKNAVELLRNMINTYPNEPIIPFYLGHMAQIGHENELALKYYFASIEMGYINADVFFAVAMLQKEFGEKQNAEKNFNKALELSEDDAEKWACYLSLAMLYLENKMYLNAEKISKILIEKYNNNYEGYHIHIVSEALKGNLDDAKLYMEKLPEKFKKHPQYFIDKIDLCKIEGNKDELFNFLNDETVNLIVPQIALREKLKQFPGSEFLKEKTEIIEILATKYHDADAIISVLILEFANKNFEKSAKIANIILENEKGNQSIRFYLALFFQIYNLYYISEKKPSEELRAWIEKAGNWCIAYTDDLEIPEIGDTIRNAIQDLFDEINNNQKNQEEKVIQ